MGNLTRIKSLRAQDYGVAGLSTTDVDWLIAEVDRLAAALTVQTELLADANAQLNATRKERDRYKAYHDEVSIQLIAARVEKGTSHITLYGSGLDKAELIVRPQPLKEGE